MLLLSSPIVVSAQAVVAPTAQAAQAAAPVSSEDEKVAVLRMFGVVPDDATLRLGEKDFVFAVWRLTTGPEVRASAELALGGSVLECTQWIKTGAAEANRRDIDKQMRDAAIAKVAWDLKQKAAEVIGVPVGPELLVKPYGEYITELYFLASGAEVKRTAQIARTADEEAQKEYLRNGIRAAHMKDQEDLINAIEQADAAEKARLKAKAARGRAAPVVGLPQTDAITDLSDDNFIRQVLPRTVEGTELKTATLSALFSSNPEDWKAYVVTGIFAANQKDIDKVLREKEAADRKRLQDILTAVEKFRLRPRLVAAGKQALAGTAADVERFLRVGQYEVVAQSLMSGLEKEWGWYARGTTGPVKVNPGDTSAVTGDPTATWRVVQGLAKADCVSLESATRPNHYLTAVTTYTVEIRPTDGSDTFKANATWCPEASSSGSQFYFKLKTLNTGLYLSHNVNNELIADFPTSAQNMRWWMDEPDPLTTEITLKWYQMASSQDDYPGQYLKPRGDEQIDGSVRYRDFGYFDGEDVDFRVYWSQATGAHEVDTWAPAGKVAPLPVYLRAGGHHSELGLPTGGYEEDATVFQNGLIQNGHAFFGAFWQKWKELGGKRSFLKWPVSDVTDIPGGRRVLFAGGRIDVDSATGVATATLDTPTGSAVRTTLTSVGEIYNYDTKRCLVAFWPRVDFWEGEPGVNFDCESSQYYLKSWTPKALAGNSFRFETPGHGKCLTAKGTANSTPAAVYKCDDADLNQRWRVVDFTSASGGYLYSNIVHVQSGRCLAFQGANNVPKAPSFLFDCKPANVDQHWFLR